MHDLGYVDGKHFVLVERFADGRVDRLPAFASALVLLRVALIYAPSSSAVAAAQAASSEIPIVFAKEGLNKCMLLA
jgi:putative ABC transport system substrate-binding protein